MPVELGGIRASDSLGTDLMESSRNGEVDGHSCAPLYGQQLEMKANCLRLMRCCAPEGPENGSKLDLTCKKTKCIY